MNDERNKQLCLNLAKAETESEVIRILQKAGYWDDEESWRYYGDSENNFSTIGNQQSAAEAALVEKIINSVDAVLTRECLRKNIKPSSDKAPSTLREALHGFFDIYDGKLTNVDTRERAKLADNIKLIATGAKSNPCYLIIDKGEGQSPKAFPNTLVSIGKSNKLRIPFVQGKFNMGATGSLQFCGNNNFQLIISKRDPEIAKFETDDDTNKQWGFTVVRRQDPSLNIRSSSFKYLAPDNKVLTFLSDSLPILPGDYPKPYEDLLEWGTVVKMYDYQLTGGLKTNIKFDLYYKLSLLMPYIALPITLYERREGYRAESYHTIMSGLGVRIDEDKRNNMEFGYPSSGEILAAGQKLKVLIYAFKKGQAEKYAPKEGIVFVVNGQAHGFIPRSFFARKSVGMQYLEDSILVILDCTEFSGRTREDLFMNSRDRLREGNLKQEIEAQLGDLIKNHQGLKELKERRRKEEIENALEDSKPLAEIINSIIKNSPTLTQLFIHGTRIKNPFNIVSTGKISKYVGKDYPTIFNLEKEYPQDKPKICHINRKFRIQFITDAENDYFNRDNEPGEFNLILNENEMNDYSINLWNGIGTLNVNLPEKINIGDILQFTAKVSDNSRIDPIINSFYIKADKADIASTVGRNNEGKRRSIEEGEDGNKGASSSLSLPNIIECKREQGDNYKFKDDQEGALIVMDTGENSYDFYINMDNVFLKTEEKGLHNQDNRILEARFKYGMVLIGLSVLDSYQKTSKDKKENEDESIYDKLYFFTKAISPMLLPMISDLSELSF